MWKKLWKKKKIIELEENVYLKMIEFGMDKKNGFKYDELIEELKPKEGEEIIISRNFLLMFSVLEVLKDEPSEHVHKHKYIVDFDATFKYLDYLELKEARENAHRASCTAIVAMVISIVTLAFSIHFSIKQINTPITINKDQIEEISTGFKNSVEDISIEVIIEDDDETEQ